MTIYGYFGQFRGILAGRFGLEFRAPRTDELAEVQQLNGLFLRLLQQAANNNEAVLGFPPSLRGPMARLGAGDLQQLAAAPRSLFSLAMEAPPGPMATVDEAWESARRAFALAALHGAWTAARYSNAVARTLYGLGAEPVRQLRLLKVADLVTRSLKPGVVTCAFVTVPGMWQTLLESPASPLPRGVVLTLIAASSQKVASVPAPARASVAL